MKKLLNGEIVSGVLNPDGTLTDVKPVINDYDIPTEDKIGVDLMGKTIWVEEESKEETTNVINVYKKRWDSDYIFYVVGYMNLNGNVVLRVPKFEDRASDVEKYSTTWYRDNDFTNNVKVSFVPSNDIYEIVNSNKNESIGYVSCEGNVIYWNQYRY